MQQVRIINPIYNVYWPPLQQVVANPIRLTSHAELPACNSCQNKEEKLCKCLKCEKWKCGDCTDNSGICIDCMPEEEDKCSHDFDGGRCLDCGKNMVCELCNSNPWDTRCGDCDSGRICYGCCKICSKCDRKICSVCIIMCRCHKYFCEECWNKYDC